MFLQNMQKLDEKRTDQVRQLFTTFHKTIESVNPIINKCWENVSIAASSLNPKTVCMEALWCLGMRDTRCTSFRWSGGWLYKRDMCWMEFRSTHIHSFSLPPFSLSLSLSLSLFLSLSLSLSLFLPPPPISLSLSFSPPPISLSSSLFLPPPISFSLSLSLSLALSLSLSLALSLSPLLSLSLSLSLSLNLLPQLLPSSLLHSPSMSEPSFIQFFIVPVFISSLLLSLSSQRSTTQNSLSHMTGFRASRRRPLHGIFPTRRPSVWRVHSRQTDQHEKQQEIVKSHIPYPGKQWIWMQWTRLWITP